MTASAHRRPPRRVAPAPVHKDADCWMLLANDLCRQVVATGVLGLLNVTHTTGLRHQDTASIYWSASLNWMPYDPALPFVKACWRLKLTDGLASGRPIVSADVPEARRYPDWIRVYGMADEAVALISTAMNTSNTDEARRLSEAQLSLARKHTWGYAHADSPTHWKGPSPLTCG